jgi:hypothetical protein
MVYSPINVKGKFGKKREAVNTKTSVSPLC